jgi:hypothetical protein
VRGVGLSTLGKLDCDTIKLAAKLELPHHEGAGGVEDLKIARRFKDMLHESVTDSKESVKPFIITILTPSIIENITPSIMLHDERKY